MSSVPRPRRPESPLAATGGRGSDHSVCACPFCVARRGGAGAGRSRAGRAGGQDTDSSLARLSHGGPRGRAGLVQTQRLAQPAGKIHFLHLGPFDEGVILAKERGACGEEAGTSLLLGPPGHLGRTPELSGEAPRTGHTQDRERNRTHRASVTPEASQAWGRAWGG